MRTFAFAQLLAATLAVNLNIKSLEADQATTDLTIEEVEELDVEALEELDWEDLKNFNDDEWLALLEDLDEDDIKALLKDIDWEDFEDEFTKLEKLVDDFCGEFGDVCKEVEKKLEDIDEDDVKAFCDEEPEVCADIKAYCDENPDDCEKAEELFSSDSDEDEGEDDQVLENV